MSLGSRRAIYLVFFVLFFVTGTVLLLYLQGYRYNPQKGKVERTGAIRVEVTPEQAQLALNGEALDRHLPATLLSLHPGDYEVELSLAGYQSWRKRLSVNASEVTFTGKVRLWPETSPGTKIIESPIALSSRSPNGANVLFYVARGLASGLWLMNLTTGEQTLVSRSAAGETVGVSWAPTSREFLATERLGNSLQFRTYSLEDHVWEDVKLPDELRPAFARWGDKRDELYIATSSELYQYDRDSQNAKLMWREKLMDFQVIDGAVIGIAQSEGDGMQVKALNLSNLQPIALDHGLTLSSNLALLQPQGDWLPLFDADRHALYLLRSPRRLASESIRKLPDVTMLEWAEDGEELLIANNFEIWRYNLEEDELTLLLRLSTPLTQARLLQEEPYVVFAAGNQVWAMELDERPEQQRWLLAGYDEPVQTLYLSPDGGALYAQTASAVFRLEFTPAGGSPARDDEPGDSPLGAIRKYLHLSILR